MNEIFELTVYSRIGSLPFYKFSLHNNEIVFYVGYVLNLGIRQRHLSDFLYRGISDIDRQCAADSVYFCGYN
jgi:hypothetical protein